MQSDDEQAQEPEVQYQREQDSGYSRRRAIYVFGVTVFSLVTAVALVVMGYTGDLATKLVGGLIDLVSTLALLYLGAGVVDRSQILHRLGDSFNRREDRREERRARDEDPPADPPSAVDTPAPVTPKP